MHSHRATFATTAIACLVTLAGCGEPGDSAVNSASVGNFNAPTATTDATTGEGSRAYAMYCVGCHGSDGDGNGPAARFLRPRPRNFQRANFKFSSTRAGQLPMDEDLSRTITEGLKGTAMSGWKLLPPHTVTALVEHIKTFSTKWDGQARAIALPQDNDPYRTTPDKTQAIARGERIYHGYAACWMCHPSYISASAINRHLVALENPASDTFRDHLHQSVATPNTEGEVLFAPDFRRDFVRAGEDVASLYRSIAAGITGTAMPMWIDSMDVPKANASGQLVTPGDLWAMAYYVQSLIQQRPDRITADLSNQYTPRDRPQRILAPGETPTPPPQEPSAPTEEFLEDDEEETPQPSNSDHQTNHAAENGS